MATTRGEDRRLFPAIAAAHPELADTLRHEEQDHSIRYEERQLLSVLETLDAEADPTEVLGPL